MRRKYTIERSIIKRTTDRKKANELDVAPIEILKLKKIRKKVDISLLNSEQRSKREQTKINRAKDHAFNKAMKNLSIS